MLFNSNETRFLYIVPVLGLLRGGGVMEVWSSLGILVLVSHLQLSCLVVFNGKFRFSVVIGIFCELDRALIVGENGGGMSFFNYCVKDAEFA